MKAALAALQFLTVLPLPRSLDVGERALGQSVWFFTLVGLGIGAAIAGIDHLWAGYVPPLPAAVLVTILLLMASGGLHIDGLADTADGFFSSRPRERVLEIMKDSRSGPMAVAAVVCVVLLKASVIASLPMGNWLRVAALVLMPAAGRTSLVLQMNVLPYARAQGGLGSVFVKHRSLIHAQWSIVVLLAAGWLTLGWLGVMASSAAVLLALLFALHCYRKIGGFTGDTLGAGCELTEIVPGLALLVCLHAGMNT
jgi:adenosylcobinamide-GDP ribazoletransferase